jgi:O-acetyl-ADP-ribose deacetylase (regulator of RNase III)
MPLRILEGDITRLKADAIVNAAKNLLTGGGGVDGAIHRAAGPALLAACRKIGWCDTGKAVITPAFNLPSKYVIHTVGPVWQGGDMGETEELASCYRESLALARQNGCRTVLFPLISAGSYRFPVELALETAVRTIEAFLAEDTGGIEASLVLFDPAAVSCAKSLGYKVQKV